MPTCSNPNDVFDTENPIYSGFFFDGLPFFPFVRRDMESIFIHPVRGFLLDEMENRFHRNLIWKQFEQWATSIKAEDDYLCPFLT